MAFNNQPFRVVRCSKCYRAVPREETVLSANRYRVCTECMSFWEFNDGVTAADMIDGTPAAEERIARMRAKLAARIRGGGFR